jgi:hypothetical protein
VSEGFAKFPGPPIKSWEHPYVAASQCPEGWRAAIRQCDRNIFDRHLTYFTFFAGERNHDGSVIKNGYPGFAPKQDGNDPLGYANFVIDYLKAALPNIGEVSVNDKVELLLNA